MNLKFQVANFFIAAMVGICFKWEADEWQLWVALLAFWILMGVRDITLQDAIR